MEVISSYAWIGWLVLILAFLVVEMLTIQLIFLMLAVGSAAGLIVGLFGVPWWVQLIVAAVVAILCLFAVRPWLRRLLHRGGDPTPTNMEAVRGLEGRVVAAITETSGQVTLANGETWSARLSPATPRTTLPDGESVLVVDIDGASVIVVPSGRNAS